MYQQTQTQTKHRTTKKNAMGPTKTKHNKTEHNQKTNNNES